jgi:hypothetical protein
LLSVARDRFPSGKPSARLDLCLRVWSRISCPSNLGVADRLGNALFLSARQSDLEVGIMKPDSSVVSVVLVGAFVPSKFVLPALAEAEVLSSSDLASAHYEMLVRDQAVHIILPWGSVQVVQERFTIEVAQAPYVRAADLILKCMREVATGSVVRQMGINLKSEYVYLDPADRDLLGRRLMPAAAWGSWGKDVAKSQELPATSLMHGGLACAVLRQQKKEAGGVEGHVDARVDAARPTNAGWGVFISINDHYQASVSATGAYKASDAVATATLLDTFSDAFDGSVARSMTIADGIIAGA